MKTLSKLIALAAVVTLSAACDSAPTAPEATAESAAAFAAAQAELSSIEGVLPRNTDTDPRTAPQPLLGRLTRIALERLERIGADDARARIVAELRERQAELRAAIESGDREAILRAKHAFDQVSARVVVAVMSPRIVPHVIQHVAAQVRALSERLDGAAADGRDVARPRQVLRIVATMLAQSKHALEMGHPIQALLLATSAGDLLHTAFHR